MEILSLSGLIEQEHYSKNTSIQQIFYESDTLLEPSKDITTVHKTLTSNKNTQIEILIETKNYFIASPHYIGSGIIYDRSLSKEQHGRLIFFVRTTSGPISIRIFSPDGQLQREEIWHIEVR